MYIHVWCHGKTIHAYGSEGPLEWFRYPRHAWNVKNARIIMQVFDGRGRG